MHWSVFLLVFIAIESLVCGVFMCLFHRYDMVLVYGIFIVVCLVVAGYNYKFYKHPKNRGKK